MTSGCVCSWSLTVMVEEQEWCVQIWLGTLDQKELSLRWPSRPSRRQPHRSLCFAARLDPAVKHQFPKLMRQAIVKTVPMSQVIIHLKPHVSTHAMLLFSNDTDDQAAWKVDCRSSSKISSGNFTSVVLDRQP